MRDLVTRWRRDKVTDQAAHALKGVFPLAPVRAGAAPLSPGDFSSPTASQESHRIRDKIPIRPHGTDSHISPQTRSTPESLPLRFRNRFAGSRKLRRSVGYARPPRDLRTRYATNGGPDQLTSRSPRAENSSCIHPPSSPHQRLVHTHRDHGATEFSFS